MPDIQDIEINQHHMDDNGLVFVFEVQTQSWVKRTPIDAKEGVALGVFSLSGPQEGEQAEAAPSDRELEEALVAMTKGKLRSLCIEHSIDHTAADTKQSLIQRLVVAGIMPK